MTDHSVNSRRRAAFFVIAVVLACFVYWIGGPLEQRQRTVLAVVMVAVVLWVSEVIPLYITSLISSFLLIVIAGFGPQEIFAPYFDSVIVLFLGGFILARGMQKHGLDSFLARSLLRRIGSNPYIFILGIMSVTAFLSMWMSNTAAAAIMVPICVVVLRENKLFADTSSFARGCLLAVAYAATIGGIGTLVGSPPNAIAVRFLAENNVERVELSFLGWMVQAFPFVVVALIFVWLMICLLNKPEVREIHFSDTEGRLTREQGIVLLVFAVTALGWLSTQLTGLSSATVALVPIILLYGLGLLDDTDLGKINWGTLLLFGGGLSLGGALTQARIDLLMAETLTHQLGGLPVFLILVILIYFGILVTMIASNTASAAILVPLMIPVAKGVGIDVKTMAAVIAIGVSLDFMMPVGTPPNAIVYSTGLVRVKHMMKNGFIMNLGTGMILALMYYFLWM
ncbi:MAG: DASS family sodium-coupled anion symporter [Acidobacteriota bacterium]